MVVYYRHGYLGDPVELTEGIIVKHKTQPGWGLGKVLLVQGNKVSVYFSQIEGSAQDAIKTLRTDMAPLVVAEDQEDPWLNNLPPFVKDGKIVATKKVRLTYDQAFDWFVRQYPGRFSDPKYLHEERIYKWDAHLLFLELLGDAQLDKLLGAGEISTIVERIRKIVQSVNLLSRYEVMALNDGLKDVAAATRYAESISGLLGAEDTNAELFDKTAATVSELPAEEGMARVFTWPIVTLLPFLAAPDRFMFLKPEVTKTAAERLGFDLLYTSTPNWGTYSRLLDMSRLLMQSLKPHGARDLIDVQSYIWATARAH